MSNITLNTSEYIKSKLHNLGLLVKFKLSLTVTFSAAMGYLIALPGSIVLFDFLIFFTGGLLITFAANALNEVLEKDFDKLMERTSNRPIPTGMISSSEAVFLAGIMCVIGSLCLAYFNTSAGFLGIFSLVLYAFLYTPFKRISPAAVWIGAVPGALPVLIGGVAATGIVTPIILVLFIIQFLWQFPHFWSIAWLSDADYKRAGFQLLPSRDGEKSKVVGLFSTIYAACLCLVVGMPLLFEGLHIFSVGLLLALSLHYTYVSWKFMKHNDQASARTVMFTSFLYLPGIMFVFWLDKILVI